MPPIVSKEVPAALRPYLAHGVALRPGSGNEWLGACPWCDRQDKFHVNALDGRWSCKVCLEGTSRGGGNAYTFLQKIYEEARRHKDTKGLTALARERGLRSWVTLDRWGVCRGPITGEWLAPGHNAEGKLTQLYRWVSDSASGKHKFLPTPGLDPQEVGETKRHGLLGRETWRPGLKTVYVCEGLWDGAALWETAGMAAPAGDGVTAGYSLCGDPARSLLASANVVAVPSANVLVESWLPLFGGTNVRFLFDNDHPGRHPRTGAVTPPPALGGLRHAVGVLATAEEKPASVGYLRWAGPGTPMEQYHDPELPAGFDVRDHLRRGAGAAARVGLLGPLLARLAPVPAGWVPGRTPGAAAGGVGMTLLPCECWADLVNDWRKPMRWIPGLDRALSVMLATVLSTPMVGDQLWVKIIGPASCGKSTLCEALSVAGNWILAKSTIRGFHSGWKTDAAGKEDHGLIPKLRGKTLVTKDGDTLLSSPNLQQILAEARDLYDSTSRSHYRHGMARDYSGVRMTWLLCGTASLRQIDQSELGERFLDCVVMDELDPEVEDEILWRVANRAERCLAFLSDGKAESQYDPALVRAMQRTGGYVDHLRRNAAALLKAVSMDDEARRLCISLGRFVAGMRARPSKKQSETAEKEFAARLVSQLVRLSKCLAVVLNRPSVDEQVLARVRQVALDTGRGQTMELARAMRRAGRGGVEPKALALVVNETDEKARTLLRFLKKIGVCEHFSRSLAPGLNGRPLWRLSGAFQALWDEVVGSGG